MKSGEEKLLKAPDATVGLLLTELLGLLSPREPEPVDIGRILLVRPGGIGDAVLLCPAIRRIKEALGAEIDVLAEKRNREVFGLCPGLRKVFTYDDDLSILKPLFRNYDLIIDTEQWHRLSAIFARLARGKLRAGFSTNNRKKLFHRRVAYEINVHESLNFLRLVACATGTDYRPYYDIPFLEVPSPYRRWARALFRRLRGERLPVAVIFPGSARPEKRWDTDKFAELAQRLENRGARIIIVGGPGDKEPASRITRSLKDPMDFSGLTNLAQTAALIEQADVFISVDSGLMHIAYGLGTPSVSLFGPGNRTKWAPKGAIHRTVYRSFSCSPCSLFGKIPKCPYNYRCMKSIEVDEVEEAVLSLLGRERWKELSSLKA